MDSEKNPFGRSLIRNGSGRDKLSGWKICSSMGDGWIVESSPAGADELPMEIVRREGNFCFATSHGICSKEQFIDLLEEGVFHELLDSGVLSMTVEDWYAGRFDCGCMYEFKVELLDETRSQVLDSYEFCAKIKQWEGKAWNKVIHTFERVPPKTRFVRFRHEGRDTQFWAGHYGSKMAGAALYINLHTERVGSAPRV